MTFRALRPFILLVAVLAAAVGSRAAEVPSILASELVPGETGYGLTVLRGDSVISFPVSFIGTLENAMVRQDIVLIRVLGEPFEKTGIIAGMSGSPIFFRGRLLGALAYGWGFTKEPIAGVTPIGLMLDLIGEQARLDTVPPGLRPLAAPLSVAGLSPERRGEAWKRIDALGFLAAPGGRAAAAPTRLVPGSAVGVRLIDGDLALTALGTVTWVQDSDVIGFGHPFLNRGASRFPMTGARVEAVMPSLEVSFKLGSATDDIGAIRRDASAGIAGRLGDHADFIPMSVAVATPWNRHDYAFRLAVDESLTAQLCDIAWSSAAEAGIFTRGPAGVAIRVAITVEGRTVVVADRGVVERTILEVMPTMPVHILYENPFRRIHPDSVAVEVVVDNDLRRHEILAVRPLAAVVAAGDTLEIEVKLQTYDAGRSRRIVSLPIPRHLAPGTLTITVSGGRGLNGASLPEPCDLEGLLRRLAAYEPQDMLVIRGERRDGSQLEVDAGLLPELPAGLRCIQSGDERGPTGFEVRVPMDAPVVGADRCSIRIKRP